MLGIIMQLKISAKRTPQVTTIIYHHMKKILLNKRKKNKKKQQKYGDYTKTHMLTKTIHSRLYLFIKNFKNRQGGSLLYQRKGSL